MRSHEKIKRIKNRVKNRRKKKFFTLEDARAGVQHPEGASGRRSTPEQSTILALNAQNKQQPGVKHQDVHTEDNLALNARNKHETGVQRQKHASHGRLTPRACTNGRLNARMMHGGNLHAYMVKEWYFFSPQDLWTPQDPHLRICGPHKIPTYLFF